MVELKSPTSPVEYNLAGMPRGLGLKWDVKCEKTKHFISILRRATEGSRGSTGSD